jgi:RNA polymerase sigma-70 factor (ECF subfamily)
MEIDDETAVARVRAGEKDFFRVLVERHSQTIFRLAFRMMQNEQDAEEVVQDTFLKAYSRLDGFQSRASFGTWIYRIAINRCYDLLDQRKTRWQALPEGEGDGPEPAEQIPSDNPGPDRSLLSREIDVSVHSAMEELTPTEHTAFVLRHFEGRSTKEIAEALNLRTAAAKHSVHRAVKKLRQQLQPLRSTG